MLTVRGPQCGPERTGQDAVGIFAPPVGDRQGQPLRLAVPPGRYTDLWQGKTVEADSTGDLVLTAPEGIAVLVGGGLSGGINE